MGPHDDDSTSDYADSTVTVLSDTTTALTLVEKTAGEIDGQLVELPTLPAIRSREVLLEVFMHRSVLGRPAGLFEDSPDDLFPDNERLEHLGDAVVQLCATMVIRELYPSLRVGPASKIRTRVVSNVALARHTERYGLIDKLAVSHAQERQLRKSIAVQGDLFEAYVGGLFKESDYSLSTVYGWLRALFTPVVHEAYKQELADHSIISGALPSPAALGAAESKSPGDLLSGSPEQPVIVNAALNEVRPPLTPTVSTPMLPSTVTAGPSSPYSALQVPNIASAPPSPYRFPAPRTESGQLSFLNQCLIQRGKTVDWKFDERGGNKTTPLWAVEAYVKNDAGRDECVGRAQAPTKKAAKNEAARQAIATLKYAYIK
ncbi:ribonuclease III [Calocera viscosa TUFC12733]|uniref:Ribonuclease III n=1 Tax=Calocera viscosa (strain TUFC12733) TaxID=1330018 RepID=A0A167KIE8_CALVF|nr:ribonuclease III [Calocera viscosa TUFC12733]